MYKLCFLFLISIIAFCSCDGRDRKFKTNAEALKENKLFNSFTEQIKYTPETYVEVITDTILSNGYTVKIKTYSDMFNSFLNEYDAKAIHHKHYYRRLISEVIIEKNNIIVFNKVVDNSFLEKQHITSHINLNDYILTPLEVNQIKSLDKNKVVLTASINAPIKENSLLFDIIIDDNGSYELKKISYART